MFFVVVYDLGLLRYLPLLRGTVGTSSIRIEEKLCQILLGQCVSLLQHIVQDHPGRRENRGEC
jgi:hypothetical protein